jgi:putative ABC transport system permease protein
MGYARFIWRNGMRHRRRALLTVGSVALALFAMLTLVGFVQEIDRNLEEASPVRVITRHAVSLTNFLPARHRALIEQVPGVVADSRGEPRASAELVVVINLLRRGEAQGANVTVRGLSPEGVALRSRVRIVEGRMFQSGLREGDRRASPLRALSKPAIGR